MNLKRTTSAQFKTQEKGDTFVVVLVVIVVVVVLWVVFGLTDGEVASSTANELAKESETPWGTILGFVGMVVLALMGIGA